MASENVWADFDTVRHNVKHNTVDRLKQIIIGFNDQCGTNFTKSGKKQELIDRITRELDLWRRASNIDKWTKAKGILNQPRSSINTYRPNGESSFNHFQAGPPMYHPTTANGIPPYDPYRQQRPPQHSNTAASTSTSATTGIQFKHSPFFRIERAVSNIVECPESTSQMDRRSQTLTFMMNNDTVSKLAIAPSKYQLRLYCTSSTYYSPTSTFRPNPGPCPMEFPPTCEVRVNSSQLSANLKGMKKKPGTAPPPDIGKHLRMVAGAANRVEMIYVNSQQPTPSKKYYLVVMLVEVTTVEQLVDRLKKGKFVSASEVMTKTFQSATDDDDIIAGHQKMTLKCPLSYVRITTPCRSIKCVHSQCFDATSWFSVMEQTTTWLCPVCEKVLNSEELIIDGYFDSILRATSEDVEDVIVEPDGQWHTADNKYASPEWLAAHPPAKAESLPPTPVRHRSPTPVKAAMNGNGPISAQIVILDSDDEEEGQVKRELSGSIRSSLFNPGSIPPRFQTFQTAESDIIDLTLDSDDDDRPIHASPPKKRKVDEQEVISPTEQVWKKSRADTHPLHSKPSGSSSASSLSNGSYQSTRDTRVLPPPTTSRFMARPSLPYAPASYIPPGGAPVPSRPSIPRTDSYPTPPPRSNGSSPWSSQRY